MLKKLLLILAPFLWLTSVLSAEAIQIPIFEDTWIEVGESSKAEDEILRSRVVSSKRQIILEWAVGIEALAEEFDVVDAYMLFRNLSYTATYNNNSQNNFCVCRRLTDKHIWDETWTWLDFGGELTVANGSLRSDSNLGLQVISGDANLDGVVNSGDLNILALNWLKSGRGWIEGDFNYDGFVGVQDLNIIGLHWQETIPDYPADVMICNIMSWVTSWKNGEIQNGIEIEPFNGFWTMASSESSIPLIFFTPPVLYVHVKE